MQSSQYPTPARRPQPRATATWSSVALTGLLAVAPHWLHADDEQSTRQLVQTECAHCHGPDGNAAPPSFPKLAGLQHDYLAKQLSDYVAGRRESQVMQPVVEKLSTSQIQDLADYFSRQRRNIGTPYLEGMVPLGRRVYHEGDRERGVPACAGCHKPDGSGTERSPLIAGQNSAYVLQQLRAFHSEQRTNDRGRLMRTTAARMTEPEMVAVAEYVAGMDVIPRQP